MISLFAGLRVLRSEDVWARPDWSAGKVEERLVRRCGAEYSPGTSVRGEGETSWADGK